MVAETERGLTYCDEGGGWQPGCGMCGNCGGDITQGRAKWFCSTPCAKNWRQNHQWKVAKAAALKRDGNHCVRFGCGIGPVPRAGAVKGQVEVNHKTPIAVAAAQQGYTTSAGSRLRSRTGCWNHLDGLETLCLSHHREETRRQREAGEL